MVETQLIPRGIHDPLVLKAMEKVPREAFVPADLRESACDDNPLPIGEGQTISQPYIVALMTEALELKGPEKVLEIGTGSGSMPHYFSLEREAAMNSGRSPGCRLETRFPSSTTFSSTNRAPAFLMSCTMDFHPVILRPFRTSAVIRI